jgi:hypothetical protein
MSGHLKACHFVLAKIHSDSAKISFQSCLHFDRSCELAGTIAQRQFESSLAAPSAPKAKRPGPANVSTRDLELAPLGLMLDPHELGASG